MLTGAGEMAFAAGVDIGELRQRTALDALASVMQGVYDEIEAYEKPTIAVVSGLALGGGCELGWLVMYASPPGTPGSGCHR